MIDTGVLALVVSALALATALAALIRVGMVRKRLDRELDASRQQADRALGRDEGAAQERLIAAQARMDRATAAALVLNPEPPTPTGPMEVRVVQGSDEPVPVVITDAQALKMADQVADRMAPDPKPEQGG